ncbi:aspartate/glutamate racemase family protein [Tatumella citrea]|nr:aspartate/glutamate racemase family protein [Tatumella citrea]
MTKSIVLLHATPVAMQPITEAMQALWPEATAIHLLDEGLSLERAKSPQLTPALADRFIRFGNYARDMGADGILATCSAFGDPLEQMEEMFSIPVLKPNEAMFEAALEYGDRIGMLATFAPAVGSMESEFYALTSQRQSKATLKTICVPGAIEALRAGDARRHHELVAEYAPQLADCQAIMLAHFSTSGALATVQAASTLPILAAPQSAVLKMKHRLARDTGSDSC